jgi:hypothetical protein
VNDPVSDQLALIRALGVLLTLFLSDVLYLQLQYVNHCKLRIQEWVVLSVGRPTRGQNIGCFLRRMIRIVRSPISALSSLRTWTDALRQLAFPQSGGGRLRAVLVNRMESTMCRLGIQDNRNPTKKIERLHTTPNLALTILLKNNKFSTNNLTCRKISLQNITDIFATVTNNKSIKKLGVYNNSQ